MFCTILFTSGNKHDIFFLKLNPISIELKVCGVNIREKITKSVQHGDVDQEVQLAYLLYMYMYILRLHLYEAELHTKSVSS